MKFESSLIWLEIFYEKHASWKRKIKNLTHYFVSLSTPVRVQRNTPWFKVKHKQILPYSPNLRGKSNTHNSIVEGLDFIGHKRFISEKLEKVRAYFVKYFQFIQYWVQRRNNLFIQVFSEDLLEPFFVRKLQPLCTTRLTEKSTLSKLTLLLVNW